MVAPGFAQRVCPIVAAQAYLLADGGDELPGLDTRDGKGVIVGARVEEDKVRGLVFDLGISRPVFGERFTDTLVDDHVVTFATFLLANAEVFAHFPIVLEEVADAQREQIGDAQCAVDADREEQQIAETPLATQLVFRVSA